MQLCCCFPAPRAKEEKCVTGVLSRVRNFSFHTRGLASECQHLCHAANLQQLHVMALAAVCNCTTLVKIYDSEVGELQSKDEAD